MSLHQVRTATEQSRGLAGGATVFSTCLSKQVALSEAKKAGLADDTELVAEAWASGRSECRNGFLAKAAELLQDTLKIILRHFKTFEDYLCTSIYYIVCFFF